MQLIGVRDRDRDRDRELDLSAPSSPRPSATRLSASARLPVGWAAPLLLIEKIKE